LIPDWIRDQPDRFIYAPQSLPGASCSGGTTDEHGWTRIGGWQEQVLSRNGQTPPLPPIFSGRGGHFLQLVRDVALAARVSNGPGQSLAQTHLQVHFPQVQKAPSELTSGLSKQAVSLLPFRDENSSWGVLGFFTSELLLEFVFNSFSLNDLERLTPFLMNNAGENRSLNAARAWCGRQAPAEC